jgi:hypothetical protein
MRGVAITSERAITDERGITSDRGRPITGDRGSRKPIKVQSVLP